MLTAADVRWFVQYSDRVDLNPAFIHEGFEGWVRSPGLVKIVDSMDVDTSHDLIEVLKTHTAGLRDGGVFVWASTRYGLTEIANFLRCAGLNVIATCARPDGPGGLGIAVAGEWSKVLEGSDVDIEPGILDALEDGDELAYWHGIV